MNAATRRTALLCREWALEKKALDPVLLDLEKIEGPARCFMICSGQSEPHLKAIAESVEEGLREKLNMKPFARDGRSGSQWIVLDYGDVLVHIMHQQKRSFYDLESLWKDAPQLK